MKKLIKYNDKDNLVLKQKATPIEKFDSELLDMVEELKKVVNTPPEEDGVIYVGLAAPQVGISKRIFLARDNDILHTIINPTIKPFSNPKTYLQGCMSFPNIWVPTPWTEKVKMKYYNEKGEVKKMRASGLMNQIIQHEYDHLDGVLMSDKDEYKKLEEEAKEKGLSMEEWTFEKFIKEN